jgi:hypothetical protein
VRGTARLAAVEGIVAEYPAAAERSFGVEQGQAWIKQLQTMLSMMRITITPEFVGLLDFQTRFSGCAERLDRQATRSGGLACLTFPVLVAFSRIRVTRAAFWARSAVV